MTTAILIDPVKRSVEIVEMANRTDVEEMLAVRKLLQAEDFESAPSLFPHTTSLVVDLFSEEMSTGRRYEGEFSVPEHILGNVRGRMLIVANEGENLTDIHCTPKDILSLIKWVPSTKAQENHCGG